MQNYQKTIGQKLKHVQLDEFLDGIIQAENLRYGFYCKRCVTDERSRLFSRT